MLNLLQILNKKVKDLLIKYYSKIIDSEFKQNLIYQKKKKKLRSQNHSIYP